MRGVLRRALGSPRGLVGFPVRVAAVGDAVVLQAEMRARSARGKEIAHLLERKVETLVAVVLAVPRVAGISLGAAPDLPRRFRVASEREHARSRPERRVGARD